MGKYRPQAGDGAGRGGGGASEGPLRLGKLQTARAAQVDPVAARPAHDPHEDRFAVGAAHDGARRVHVDVHPTDRVDRAAARARRLGGGHLHRKDLAQQAPNGVAVELHFAPCARPALSLVDAHVHPPVAPNLSVLIQPGSYSIPTSKEAAASTNDVGPQTKTAGASARGHATAVNIASSSRLVKPSHPAGFSRVSV